MSNLDAWKSKSIFEVDLASGVHVKGRFLDMEAVILAGGFDYAILEGMTNGKKPEQPSQNQVAEGIRYKREVVKSCLLEVAGEPVSLTDEDYALVPEDDRTEFFGYANRTVPLPVRV